MEQGRLSQCVGQVQSTILGPAQIGVGQQVPPLPVELPLDVAVDAATQASVDALFQQAVKKKIKSSEADAFWNSSGEKSELDGASNADALSYEQARKLGLTPKNGEESAGK